jgi:hypothetical protein
VTQRRLVVAALGPPVWAPASVDPTQWRLALAEDLLDVLARMVEVEAAIAAPDADCLSVGWPGLRRYSRSRVDILTL